MENARFLLQADEVVSLAQDVEENCTTLSDDLVHGRSLLGLGDALYHAQRWQEALCYMDHARTMFKAVRSTFNLASAYQSISWVHLAENRLSDALDAIEEAWKCAELTASRTILISISIDVGRILFNTNRDTKAWKHFEISLVNASYIGDRQHVARALEYMGYGYLRKGDYSNAYGAYEAAAEKYLGTIDAYIAEQCKDNMARIELKQGDPDNVVGFCRPLLDFDQTVFYPPVEPFASGHS